MARTKMYQVNTDEQNQRQILDGHNFESEQVGQSKHMEVFRVLRRARSD